MTINLMPTREYLQGKGNQCPYCRAKNTVEGGSFNVDEDYAWQEVSCNACKGTWEDIYTLAHYDPIDIPNLESDDE